MIDRNTVERIIDAAEITDVIGEFVSLKRRGVNYLGLCPFHDEKTPSFTVSSVKGIYKCFGCGKGGNSVNFIMEHEQLSYPDALRFLAKKYNVEIVEKEETEEEKRLKTERDSLLIATDFASKYFEKQLHTHSEGISVGLSYFKERGFRNDIVKKFQLGFSLNSRDAFSKSALSKGYKKEILVKTGLSIQRENMDVFDRFWGRVMFPIHNLAGRVIAFGGRTLRNDKKTAKYLNSPESELYHKSRILYGIYFAKRSIVQQDKCFMVEGYTDVISLHQTGIENVVASSGTSLTVEQIKLVKRFTQNLTILYDGDNAGIKASLRGINLVLEQGLNVKVLLLPDGEDPDSFSKKMSSAEFIEYINKHEEDFIKFKTRLLLGEAKNDPIKRANLISDIVSSITIIPDKIVRSVYVRECSEILQMKEEILYSEIAKQKGVQYEKKIKGQQNTRQAPPPVFTPNIEIVSSQNMSEAFEKELVWILINHGTKCLYDDTSENIAQFIIKEIENDQLEFRNELYYLIFQEFKNKIEKGITPEGKYFLNYSNEKVNSFAADMLQSKYELSNLWKKGDGIVKIKEIILEESVPKIVLEYKSKRVAELLKETLQKIKTTKEESVLLQLMQQYQSLKKIEKIFAKELGERTIIQ